MRPLAEREFARPRLQLVGLSPVRAALLDRPAAKVRSALPTDSPPLAPADDPVGQRADLVQVDGERVLTFSAGQLRIFDTSRGKLKLLGSLPAVGGADDQRVLLLPGQRALLLGSYADDDKAPADGPGPWTR